QRGRRNPPDSPRQRQAPVLVGRAPHRAGARTGDGGVHSRDHSRACVRGARHPDPTQSASETPQEMTTLDLRRQFFAEELEAVCRLRSPLLVKAFAIVPREQFLGRGPWMVLSENPFMSAAMSFGGTGLNLRETPDADPGR